VGVVLVIIFEPPVQRREHGIGVGQRVYVSIIAFEGFDKTLRHAVGLWTGDRREAGTQVQSRGEPPRFQGGIATAIVRQELDGQGGLQGFEPLLDGMEHQIAHHGAADALIGDGVPADDFPIERIDQKNHPDDFRVPADDLEGVGTPTQVGAHDDDLAVMYAPRPVCRPPLQKPALHGHDPIDTLVIDGGKAGKGSLLVEQAGNPPVAVGRPPVHDPADLGDDPGVFGLAIAAPRARGSVQSLNQVGPGHLESPRHGLHRPAPFGSNGSREIRFF